MEETTRRRLSRIKKALAARDLDALLITCPENRYYLSGFWAEDLGFTESSGALLITRHENLLLTDGRYEEQARSQAPSFAIHIYKKGLPRLLSSLFRQIGITRCGYEPSFLSCSRFEHLKKAVYPARFVDFGNLVFRMRAIKDNKELEKTRAAQDVAEEVFEGLLSWIRPGMTEKEVAFEILKGLSMKADGPSFAPIVASGPNSALPHAIPQDRPIEKGEPVIIDMGARLDGYCSDMTRTIFLGEPNEYFKRIYMVVKEAQNAAQTFVRAGVTAKEADAAARNVIKDHGYGQYFCHGLGHGVGIAIHEAPALSFRNRKKLRSSMVVTIEPGIYVPGKGGVRLENMGIVREKGLTLLTSNKWYYDFRI